LGRTRGRAADGEIAQFAWTDHVAGGRRGLLLLCNRRGRRRRLRHCHIGSKRSEHRRNSQAKARCHDPAAHLIASLKDR
jgi:hypothetical protein